MVKGKAHDGPGANFIPTMVPQSGGRMKPWVGRPGSAERAKKDTGPAPRMLPSSFRYDIGWSFGTSDRPPLSRSRGVSIPDPGTYGDPESEYAKGRGPKPTIKGREAWNAAP